MTGFELRLWRKGQGWTQAQAADAFGLSLRTWIRYEQGTPPRMVDLAIQALSLAALATEIDRLSALSTPRSLTVFHHF